ncbi:MAG: lipoate--protein ligase family protein [Anaerolineae bacterium]|nr:lipoate--protein ligase family protein [Gemmatimonadaceae bacterium]
MSADVGFRWLWLLSPPLTGAQNMALDEALMLRAAERGERCVRVYEWARPTLSLGRNQIARGHYDLARAEELGIDIVRRLTGGRAVLHHREITYSLASPVDGFGDLRESCGVLNRILLNALAQMSVSAEMASPSGRTPVPDTLPCFDAAAPGEIVWEGRKLVGSAQVRHDGALLQHGSILVEDDQQLACDLALFPTATASRPATLFEQLGRAPAASEFARTFVAALGAATVDPVRPFTDHESLMKSAEALQQKYESDDWTWRH